MEVTSGEQSAAMDFFFLFKNLLWKENRNSDMKTVYSKLHLNRLIAVSLVVLIPPCGPVQAMFSESKVKIIWVFFGLFFFFFFVVLYRYYFAFIIQTPNGNNFWFLIIFKHVVQFNNCAASVILPKHFAFDCN